MKKLIDAARYERFIESKKAITLLTPDDQAKEYWPGVNNETIVCLLQYNECLHIEMHQTEFALLLDKEYHKSQNLSELEEKLFNWNMEQNG